MRRLLPEPAGEISVAEACAAPRPRPPDRPWVEICMVASVDGAAVVGQRSGALSGDADRAMFHGLRSIADVIVVGAGTVRAEGYGPPAKPGQRIGVVSRIGALDLSAPLFTSGAGFLILPETAPPVSVDSVRAGTDRLDLAGALRQLDADIVQVEGGPGLNAELVGADLVDELNLTVSPLLAGGDGPRIVDHATPVVRRLGIAQLTTADGFLFTRWVRASPSPDRTAPGA